MKLTAVLAYITTIHTPSDPDAEAGVYPDVDVSAVVYDSRKATPGCLFAAVKGEKSDGHAFIPAAIEKGASVILHQGYNGSMPAGVTFIRVTDSRRAMAIAAANFHGEPSRQLKLTGITGTNGKTTTSYLVKAVLEYLGHKTGLLGTITYMLGDKRLPATNTTPESVDLQGLLAWMVDEGAGYAVIEVSSHAVALDRIAGCEFAVKVFSNLTQDHLDFHGDMASYYAAKKRLFTDYAGANAINADDANCADLSASAKGVVYTYGIDNEADIRAIGLSLTANGISFKLVTPGGEAALNSHLVGRHNAYNILAAAAACHALGISPEDIADGIASMNGVPGRLEKVDAGQRFAMLVDYAHTDDALVRVIKAAREITPGRLITVFGCGGDRDRTKRPKMGVAAANGSDIVVLTSDNPRTEDPEAIMNEAEAGVLREGVKRAGVDYFRFTDRKEAIFAAVIMAQPDDTVLITGKGHEDYQIIGSVKQHFDDREVARAAVAAKPPG